MRQFTANAFLDLEAMCSKIAGCPIEITHMGGGSFSLVSDSDQTVKMKRLGAWLKVSELGRAICANKPEYDLEADCTVLYLNTKDISA